MKAEWQEALARTHLPPRPLFLDALPWPLGANQSPFGNEPMDPIPRETHFGPFSHGGLRGRNPYTL